MTSIYEVVARHARRLAAIPFYPNTVLADLVGTAVLFGLGPLVERVFGQVNPHEAGAADEPGRVDPNQAA